MNNTADRKFNNTDDDEGIVKYKDDSFDDDDGDNNSNDKKLSLCSKLRQNAFVLHRRFCYHSTNDA